MKRIYQFLKRCQEGQSLVETALIMPILLLLMVGMVEVGHIVLVQNRVSTAARSGARFGANGGEDLGILNVTLNTITQTLTLDEDEWDIWIVRGSVDEFYNIPPEDFSFTHTYGSQMTKLFTETNTITFTNELRLRIQEQLRLDEDGGSGADSRGLNFVGVYALFNLNSILGLDVVETIAGYETAQALSVMRRSALGTSADQSAGCRGVYPIAIEEGVRTIDKEQYEDIMDEFTYPTLPPDWNSFTGQPPDTQEPLLAAKEGYIFKFNYNPYQPQGFDWLKWDERLQSQQGGGILATSMAWPGNSSDYQVYGDSPPEARRGYVDPMDPTDTQLHINNRLAKSPEGFAAVQGLLNSHIDTGRTLRTVIWRVGYTDGPYYRATGFAVFRVIGYSTPGQWLLMELYRLDFSCGQVLNN